MWSSWLTKHRPDGSQKLFLEGHPYHHLCTLCLCTSCTISHMHMKWIVREFRLRHERLDCSQNGLQRHNSQEYSIYTFVTSWSVPIWACSLPYLFEFTANPKVLMRYLLVPDLNFLWLKGNTKSAISMFICPTLLLAARGTSGSTYILELYSRLNLSKSVLCCLCQLKSLCRRCSFLQLQPNMFTGFS